MIRLPNTRSSARVRLTDRTSLIASSVATRASSLTPSTSSSISANGGSPSTRRTVARARMRPPAPLERAAQGRLAAALDLEFDLGQWWIAFDAADRGQRADATADPVNGPRDTRERVRAVDAVEADQRPPRAARAPA